MRCSKEIPCSNCMKRGIASECHREPVLLTKQKRLNNPASNERQFYHDRPTSPVTANHLNTAERVSTPTSTDSPDAVTHSSPRDHRRDPGSETFGVLESLAWGRYSNTPQSTNSRRPARYGTSEDCPNLLPLQQEDAILAFHKNEIAWMHNVIHMPTFMAEWAERRQQPRDRWTAMDALYFALMATGLYYMSSDQHGQIGIRAGFKLSEKLYRKAVMILDLVDFMAEHSVYSLQAICTFLPCAYGFGDYKRALVLLSAATNIAQCMQLHRIDSANKSSVISATDETLQQEIKRRIWCFLVIQDTYLIAAKKTYNIILEHCTTSLPAHIEEPTSTSTSERLEVIPLEIVTQNSYILLHYHLSRVFRTLHSRTGPAPTERPSLDRLYQRVLEADEQLTEFMELAPSWVKQDQSNGDDPDANLPSLSSRMANSQRKTFQIAFLHMRSKIHQPFYCRAFTDKRFYYSKATCLDSARTLLKIFAEADQALPAMWTMTSHVVCACLTIGIHLLFPQHSTRISGSWERSTMEAADRALVNSCMTILAQSERPCSVAKRGVKMLAHLFSQQQQQIPPNMIIDRERVESILQENETSSSEEEEEEDQERLSISAFGHELDEVVGGFELFTNSHGYCLEDFAAT
ncbi:hypothetical protein PV08_09327 [Exophiala spinifera]|uniref:Xylanolytic transcriptional activator regulatory domain-containing protein n=1 Tax=Exophiala spinifera TaxID=91928 RepID=A0A0D2AZF3_9EURO|nr:uncharacterized protein PV08_09327 [Exophiala spinifera]KIW12053.1 hypothetical protein PV08_09327 [Exophiala spinifera]